MPPMWDFVTVYVALCSRLCGTLWPPMWHLLGGKVPFDRRQGVTLSTAKRNFVTDKMAGRNNENRI